MSSSEVGQSRPMPALGGVHRLGHAEAVRPKVAAEGECRVPVDGGRKPRFDRGERVGHDVRRRKRDAIPARRARWRGPRDRSAQSEWDERPPVCGSFTVLHVLAAS